MRKCLRAMLVIAVTLLLCIAMNAAAFLIDTPTLRENARQGTVMYAQEGSVPQLVGGFKTSQLDNFTAVLILKTAAYTGPESHLHKTFGGIRTDMPAEEGQSPWDAFCTYADGSLSPTGGLTYTRYWHGYTLPVRLLLCVLNAANIQMALYYAQFALAIAVFILASRRCPAVLPGLVFAFFLLMPAATGVCLQYAPVTLLALAACLLVLLADAHIARLIGMPAFFALIGLLTNYFDLLTFPLVTLGFPLALLMALRLEDARCGMAAMFWELFFCGLCWGVGYGGMWAFKWLLNAAVFGPDRLASIFGQVALRVSTSSNGEAYSRLAGLMRCIEVIAAKPAYLLLGAGTALCCCGALFGRACAAHKTSSRVPLDARALLLFLLALVPIAWSIAMANHCYDHAFFTYRNLTVTVLALCTAVPYLIPTSGGHV